MLKFRGTQSTSPPGTDARWIWGRHFATKSLCDAWGPVFCLSSFDVTTACCDFPTPQRRDSFACLETVGGGKREGACIQTEWGSGHNSPVTGSLQGALYVPRVLAQPPPPTLAIDKHQAGPPPPRGSLSSLRTPGPRDFKLAFQSKRASKWISDQRGKRGLCGCWVLQRCPLMKGSVVLAGKEARPDHLGPLG